MRYPGLITLIIFLLSGLCLSAQKVDFGNSNQAVHMVHFVPNSSYLVAGGFMKIWDINNPETPAFNSAEKGMEFATSVVINSDITNDGRYLAVVTTGRIEVYDLKSRKVIRTFRGMGLGGVAFAPDNKSLAYVSTNGTLTLFNVETGVEVFQKKFKVAKPFRVAWSNNGNYIAMGGRGDNVVLLNITDKEIYASASTGGKWVMDLEFSPDSKYLAAGLRGGAIRIIETDSGNQVGNWQAHANGTNSLAFHPGGVLLASGGGDKLIAIWKFPGGEPVTSWQAHQMAVSALDFSTDGTMLASGSNNLPTKRVKDTRIWDLTTRSGLAISSALESEQEIPSENNTNYIVPDQAVKEMEAVAIPNQKRLALIIGNSLYLNGGILANPVNDANDIGAKLNQLGFEVMLYNNLTQSNFKEAIDQFGSRLAGYDVGLFYYAGHGIQVKGSNYLIPVDANLKTENDVEYDCVDTGRLLAKMEDAGSKTNIIILDACRDNPFERSWRRSTQGSGLAFMTAPAGSLISYATSPGATASDGSGKNGLYTSALLTYIDEPGISLLEMFQKVRTFVRENSGGEQVPWESTSLEGNFYFK